MVKVKDIMRKYVVTLGPKATLEEAAKIMTNNKIGSIIIVEGNEPTGIVTSEEMVSAIADGVDPKKTSLKKMAKNRLITAAPEDDVLKVSRKMVKNGIKRMPVVKNKQLVGIVSDKEIMLTTPEMLGVISERLKASVALRAPRGMELSGICEDCGEYADSLRNVNGRWICEDCRISE